jgi:rhodanese-related sulfurtransferase
MPAAKLAEMHESWNKEKYPTTKRTIFNLRDKKAPIVVVAGTQDADEAIEAYEVLTFWGFKNVTILNGGIEQWAKAGLPVSKEKIATELVYEKKLAKGAVEETAFAKAAKEGGAVIVDVRNPDERSHGFVKGSVNLPLGTLDQNLAKVPKDKPVYLHCAAGARASLAYTLLVTKGFTNVKYLNDSFEDVAKDNGIVLEKPAA